MGMGQDVLYSAIGKTVRFSARVGLQLLHNQVGAEVRGLGPVGKMSYGNLLDVFVFASMGAEVRGLSPVGKTSSGCIFNVLVFDFESLSGSLQVLHNHEEFCEFWYFIYEFIFHIELLTGFTYE